MLRGQLYGLPDSPRLSVEVEGTSEGFVARADGVEVRLVAGEVHLEAGGTDNAMLVLSRDHQGVRISLYLPMAEAQERYGHVVPETMRARMGALAQAEQSQTRSRHVIAWVALVLCLVGGWGAWKGVGVMLESFLDRIPSSWEVSLGEATVTSIAPEDQRLTDPRLTKPVEEIGKRLLSGIQSPYPFHFHVVKDETVNAFALPGGQVVVHTGLLDAATGPEQVAGVLAHEIQHVLKRHGLKKIMNSIKWSLALSLLIGDVESIYELVASHAAGLLELGYDRESEREADSEGLKLLHRVGIDARGLPEFFKILKEKTGILGDDALAFLSTHPGHDERISRLNAMIPTLGDAKVETLDLDWAAMKTALGEIGK